MDKETYIEQRKHKYDEEILEENGFVQVSAGYWNQRGFIGIEGARDTERILGVLVSGFDSITLADLYDAK